MTRNLEPGLGRGEIVSGSESLQTQALDDDPGLLTPEAAAMSRAVVRAYPFSIRQRFAPASRASRFPMASSILLVLNKCLERLY